MAPSGSALRRGLPRVAGGPPWPPEGEVSAEAAEALGVTAVAAESVAEVVVPEPVLAAEPVAAPAVAAGPAVALRRGLPRTAGGDPWPPAELAAAASPAGAPSDAAAPQAAAAESVSPAAAAAPAPAAVAPAAATGSTELRRGLPRVDGGEPWPPAGTVAPEASSAPAPAAVPAEAPVAASTAAATPGPVVAVADAAPAAPLTLPRTVFPTRGSDAYEAHKARGFAGTAEPAPEPKRIGPFTRGQWAGAVLVGGIGLLGAAAMAVFVVRFLLSLGPMQDFLTTYPGEYHLPEGAPVGFPAWLGWQHFFNVFLMVLIIRSGLAIRNEKRPAVFWTPRGDKKAKTSLTIWFHQSLDLLWIINGAIFVVLLFVTGQWMRIVPTSWEVFPNAISAALQYVSLDWPTENGWVNYNALQQLAYFSTVFIAAPLAIITGYRMSGLWPKNNAKLNAAYPIEWARKVHFPTMLFFVVFIAIHVFLVFATGALRNLNHMYAAQGSVDPTAYADNWTGFWFFVASMVVIAGAWIAARPLVLAPIARLFGTVSGR